MYQRIRLLFRVIRLKMVLYLEIRIFNYLCKMCLYYTVVALFLYGFVNI